MALRPTAAERPGGQEALRSPGLSEATAAGISGHETLHVAVEGGSTMGKHGRRDSS